MVLKGKTFRELSTEKLYEILRSRVEIFIVKQNCVYQDPDGRDQKSLHIFLKRTAGSQPV